MHLESWPTYDPALAREEEIVIVLQVDGKLRDRVKVNRGASREELEQIALANPRVKARLDGARIARVVHVEGRVVNVVTQRD